jgi:hypothetical protein
MPKIVACMRAYDALDRRAQKVIDYTAEELIQAVFYSYVKYKAAALKELPKDAGAVIAGPQGIKEIFASVKAEMGDLAQKMGERFVLGVAESLAQNMPLYRITRPVRAPDAIADATALAEVPRRSVLDMLIAQRSRGSRFKAGGELEFLDEAPPKAQVSAEIKAIEEELAALEIDSIYAKDIQLYEKFLWQTTSLRKRIWLFVFHLSNFCWNSCEAEKARTREGLVKMLLWAAGAVFSGFELRKSASFSNVFSFYCYTPERFGLTTLKVCFITMFLFQYLFTSGYRELDHIQSCDLTLEKLIISVIGSTAVTVIALSILKRGYDKKIEARQRDMQEHRIKLEALLEARRAIADKA